MFTKILSGVSQQVFVKKVREIIDGQLEESEIALITEIYRKRQLDEHFLVNLQGYLAYLDKPRALSCASSLNPLLNLELRNFFKGYGFAKVIGYGENGYCKAAYLSKSTNEVLRLYYGHPAAFFYKKMLGTSEANICQAVNNNLLTVAVQDIPGAPFDVSERALPLVQALAYLERKGQRELIAQIEIAKRSNVFIKSFMEAKDRNIGLAVRTDSRKQKRVYVVAFDLEPRVGQILSTEILKCCADLMPHFLSYEQLAKALPRIQELTPCFSPLLE